MSDRRMISMKVPSELLDRIDAAAGKGERTRWILDACLARLDPVRAITGAPPELSGYDPADVAAPGGVRDALEAAEIDDTAAENAERIVEAIEAVEKDRQDRAAARDAPEPCSHTWVTIVGKNRCSKCKVWKH